MTLRGEDILKALGAIYGDDAQMREFARRQAFAMRRRALERGRHGEVIKNVTEASIVASETHKLTPPPPDKA